MRLFDAPQIHRGKHGKPGVQQFFRASGDSGRLRPRHRTFRSGPAADSVLSDDQGNRLLGTGAGGKDKEPLGRESAERQCEPLTVSLSKCWMWAPLKLTGLGQFGRLDDVSPTSAIRLDALEVRVQVFIVAIPDLFGSFGIVVDEPFAQIAFKLRRIVVRALFLRSP